MKADLRASSNRKTEVSCSDAGGERVTLLCGGRVLYAGVYAQSAGERKLTTLPVPGLKQAAKYRP